MHRKALAPYSFQHFDIQSLNISSGEITDSLNSNQPLLNKGSTFFAKHIQSIIKLDLMLDSE